MRYRYTIEQVFVIDGVVEAENSDEAVDLIWDNVPHETAELMEQYLTELSEADASDD